jgi:DivIVA domain-containing protein
MAVSAEQLRSLRFDEGIRGYDRKQVDKVIARVADLVEELQNRLSEAESRAAAAEARMVEREAAGARPAPAEAAELDETLRRTLVLAQRTADAAVKEAREEAASIRQDARQEADALLADARSRADELDREADARRAALVADAEADVAKLLDETRRNCEDRVAAVEAELTEAHDTRRDELLSQIEELSGIRDVLVADVERLEQHVDERTNRLRAAVAELAELIDDPDTLQPVPAPETSDLEPLDLDGYDATSLVVPALNDLQGAAPASEPAAAALLLGEVAVAASEPASGAVDVVDLVGSEDGPVTEAHPVIDAGPDDLALDDAWAGLPDDPEDDPARPAWADAVPPAQEAADPFLEELRRAAGDDDAGDEAMERFFTEADEDRRSGWFRRRG